MIPIPDDRTLTGLGREELLNVIRQLRGDQLKASMLLAAAKRFFNERLTLEVTDDLKTAVDAFDEKKEAK